MSCVNALEHPANPPDFAHGHGTLGTAPDYAWTDLTYLLHAHHVGWGYYVFPGTQSLHVRFAPAYGVGPDARDSTLAIDSVVGQGTTVHVLLPAALS